MNDYIAHHGIKGQKWGVRRYQNADGSLTAAGQDRYNRAVNEANWAHRTAKRFTDAYDQKVSKRAHYDEEAIANRNEKIKKVAVAGAAVAGTALAAYGMYKFSQSPSGKMLISAGKQKFSESFSNAKNTAMRNIKNSNAYIAGKSYMDSVRLSANKAKNTLGPIAREAKNDAFIKALNARDRVKAGVSKAKNTLGPIAREAKNDAFIRALNTADKVGSGVNNARTAANSAINRGLNSRYNSLPNYSYSDNYRRRGRK